MTYIACCPRYADAEDMLPDYDQPLDMDEEYNDKWLSMAIGGGLAHSILSYPETTYGRAAHPWATDPALVQRIVGSWPERMVKIVNDGNPSVNAATT